MPPGQSKHVYNQERSYRRTSVPAPLSSFLRPPFVKPKNVQLEHFTAFLLPRRAIRFVQAMFACFHRSALRSAFPALHPGIFAYPRATGTFQVAAPTVL